MSATDADSIVLQGPPRGVSGNLAIDVSKSLIVPISISVGKESTVYRAVMRSAGTHTAEIRLQLPADTPPGVYPGEATINGQTRRVRIEIEPVLRISVQPRQTKVKAATATSVEFAFTVVNGGNIPFDVPQADVFDLDDGLAQEGALGRTLRAELTPGEHRIDRLFEELRDGHGGEARVAVQRGAGPLRPGETRELACLLDVPSTAKAGRSYAGPWHLGNAAHVIVADIQTNARPGNGKTKQ